MLIIAFRDFAPWATWYRQDLLELLDRLQPTIGHISVAIEQEAETVTPQRHLVYWSRMDF